MGGTGYMAPDFHRLSKIFGLHRVPVTMTQTTKCVVTKRGKWELEGTRRLVYIYTIDTVQK